MPQNPIDFLVGKPLFKADERLGIQCINAMEFMETIDPVYAYKIYSYNFFGNRERFIEKMKQEPNQSKVVQTTWKTIASWLHELRKSSNNKYLKFEEYDGGFYFSDTPHVINLSTYEGQWSGDTCRLIDILYEVLDNLNAFYPKKYDELKQKYKKVFKYVFSNRKQYDKLPLKQRENVDLDAEFLYDEVTNVINELLPSTHYFGGNEGDGASVGVWELSDEQRGL